MTTALYILRVVQIGFKITDLDTLDFGMVMDVLTESTNDTAEYKHLATQEDFDRFKR